MFLWAKIECLVFLVYSMTTAELHEVHATPNMIFIAVYIFHLWKRQCASVSNFVSKVRTIHVLPALAPLEVYARPMEYEVLNRGGLMCMAAIKLDCCPKFILVTCTSQVI